MIDFLFDIGIDYGPWIKAIHVIFVISWMAGMLYLPRLFVYHTGAEKGSQQDKTFKIMEQKLLKYIINPAMIVTLITGFWLGWTLYLFQPIWLHVKIFMVILLLACHGFLSAHVKKFKNNKNQYSEKFWRICNEIPSLLMIFIVILVVVKPF